MIAAPALWLALLTATPAEANLDCDLLVFDRTAFYTAEGDLIVPREVLAWQCVEAGAGHDG